ncbi:MAG: hypothetical protein ACRDSP_13230 [Pseudonocardiaceae bacterium]
MTDQNRRRPWLNTPRRELAVRGRQGVALSMVIAVYRDTVWVSVEPSFNSDVAVLDPPQVDNLINTLTWAVTEARGYPGS